MRPLSEENCLLDTQYFQSIIEKFGLDKTNQINFLPASEVERMIGVDESENYRIDDLSINEESRSSNTSISFDSITSSSSTSSSPTNSKRGRKRKSNHQLNLIDQSENRIIRFGNSYVEKDSPAYNYCRIRNNVAVERCRQKKADIKRKEEEKFNQMTTEVENLKTQLHKLKLEVEYWKYMATNGKSSIV
jgi:hypothetical protein